MGGLGRYSIAALVLVAFTTIYWTAFSVNNFNTYREWADLSIFNYDFFLHVSNPGLVGGLQYLVFGNHIAPLQLLVVPIYAIFQSPITLLVVQVLVLVSLTGTAIYFISKDLLKDEFLALAICFAYLFNPGMHGAFIFDYHVEYFIPLLFLMVFYFYMKNNKKFFMVSLVLLLLAMESAVYLTLALGAFLFVYEYRYGSGIDQNLKKARFEYIKIIIAASIISFVLYELLSNIIIGSYAISSQVPPLVQLFQQYNVAGNYIANFASNPYVITQTIENPFVVYGLVAILLGFGIAALLMPDLTFLLLLPWLAFGFLGNRQFFYVTFHYDAFALGGTVAVTILSLVAIKGNGKHEKILLYSPKIIIGMSFLIFMASPIFTVSTLPYRVGMEQEFLFSPIYYQNQFAQADSIIALIPKAASLVTMNFVMSHLPQREYLSPMNTRLWFLPQFILADFDHNITSDADSISNYQGLLNLTVMGNYSQVARNGSAILYEKVMTPPGPYLHLGEAKYITSILNQYNLTVFNTPVGLDSMYANSPGYLTGNVTEAWHMSYSGYPTWLAPPRYQSYQMGITEFVFETSKPRYLYSQFSKSSLVNSLTNRSNVVISNATYAGMTYSFVNKTVGDQLLEVFYCTENGKADYVTISTVVGRVNNTALISTVARDLQ